MHIDELFRHRQNRNFAVTFFSCGVRVFLCVYVFVVVAVIPETYTKIGRKKKEEKQTEEIIYDSRRLTMKK